LSLDDCLKLVIRIPEIFLVHNYTNKMKAKNYNNVATVHNKKKIVERGKMDTPNI